MYITDMRHFDGIEFDLDAPRPAQRFVFHLAGIVKAATASPEEPARRTALPCRRRPGRRPCPGLLLVERLEVPSRIRWECPACGEAGVIDGWKGSSRDLSDARLPTDGEPDLTAVLPENAYRMLRTDPLLDRESERLLYAARPHEKGVELSGSEGEFELLIESVAFEANHAENRRLGRRWDAIFALLEEARCR